MASVRAGFDNLFTIPVGRRLPNSSILLIVCLVLAPPTSSNAVFGQDAVNGLSATLTRPIHPILIRNEHGPLLCVVVHVDSGVETQANTLAFKLDGTDDMSDLESLTLYDTDDQEAFSSTTRLGEPAMPAAEVTFRVDQPLRAGKSVFWLSCRLKATAALHHRIVAACWFEKIPLIELLEPTRRVAARDVWQREISQDGADYLERLRRGTPFGTNNFDLKGLRAGIGTRHEPTVPGGRLLKVKVGDVPCEWVPAPGADPDVRLLYLHGGG